jgi:hypothetical protein
MRFPMTRTMGYRLCKRGELGCPSCVFCVTDKIAQPKIRTVRWCNENPSRPLVAKDCRCNNFLKIRSGTETAA